MFSWVSNVLLQRQKAHAQPAPPPAPAAPIITTPFYSAGSLYSRDSDTEVYRPLCASPGTLTLFLEQIEHEHEVVPIFSLKILDEDKELMFEQRIEEGTQMRYHHSTACAMWPSIVENEVCYFAFQFADNAATGEKATSILQKFVVTYNRFTYMQLTRTKIEDPDVDSTTDETYQYVAGAGTTRADSDEEGGEEEEAVFAMSNDPITRSTTSGNGLVNACFADSIQHHRAFLLRVNPTTHAVVAEAHAHGEDTFTGEAQSFQVPSIQSAKQALLSENERSMFVLDDLQGQLANLDLDRGEVVQTYAPKSNGVEVPIESVTYSNKFAAANPFLLTGITNNCGFMMDTRLDGTKCIVSEEGKGVSDYSITLKPKANKFTCHATSRNGFLAIGDQSGELRLYTGAPGAKKPNGKGHFPKSAKTALKCGEPIVYLDMTADGELILATTPTQVLVIATKYLHDEKVTNGFEDRMGPQKPTPLRLLPSPQQIAAMGKHVAFTRAVFEKNEQGEHWITASCGSFLCTWSLDSVRRALPQRNAVHCESRDTKRGNVRGFELEGSRDVITFMSEGAIGIQRRASETPKRRRSKTTFRL